MKKSKTKYYVYILECRDKTLYTGYAKNLNERIQKHNDGKGAKYTRGRGPVKLTWSKTYSSISKALMEEARIKKLTRKQKLLLTKAGGVQ